MTIQQFVLSTWRKSSHSGTGGAECVEVAALWRKGSHSGGGGSECVEAEPFWKKSSHSGGEGQECVEVAASIDRGVALRDSKDVDGSVLAIAPAGWVSLLADIKGGSLDLTS